MSDIKKEWIENNKKEIELLAYFKWVEADRPFGRDAYFWNLAEEELWEKSSEIIEITYSKKKKVKKSEFNFIQSSFSYTSFAYNWDTAY